MYVPLVLARFDAAIPVNTELSVVFKMELFAVDNDEIPNVMVPSTMSPDNLPKSVVLAMMML